MKKYLLIKKLFCIAVSILLTNSATVFAATKSKGSDVSLPEYQIGFDSLNSVQKNVTDEEKENLLKKYFANSTKGNDNQTNFEEAKAQLEKDGYTVIQDYYAVTNGYDNGSWIVGKYLDDNSWVGMTVYPFNENGDYTLDVKAVEGLFDAYEELKSNGYSVSCSDLTSFYTYHSHGTSPYGAIQITGSSWTISKNGESITIPAFDDNGKINVSLSNVTKLFAAKAEQTKFEEAKAQLEKDGYRVIQDHYNQDAWIVEKKINGTTTCLTVYPFDENGKSTINVQQIEGLFNSYAELKKAGYSVTCSGKSDLYYYFSLGKGQYFEQITTGTWTIKKDGESITIPAFDDNGKINVSLSNVTKLFAAKAEQTKFEKAKAQLEKDGYRVIQDHYNQDAWIVEKKINGTTTCLTVYPFDENGKSTINVQQIEGLFNSYAKLKKAGYSVTCSGKSDLYYYFSLGKGQYFEQITTGTWTIKKDGESITIPAFDDNGKINVSLSNVTKLFAAKAEQTKFEKAKAQLEKDGYRVIQDHYNQDAWIVEKKINGTTTCLTVYPFDKNGKSTINVQQIEGLFNSYAKLKKAGYSVTCSGKSDLYYYFSLGKGQYFEQITTGTWTIKKDGQTLKLNSVDNNKAAINVSNVNKAFSMVKELNGKKSSGYKYTAKFSGSNIVISRIKGGKTQSFKLDLNNNFGNQVLSKYNTPTKIISNFAKLRTAATTYNSLLTTISKLKTSINTNVSKLSSSNITKSILSNIKNRQKTISSLVSQISSKINSLKGFFNNTTYNSLKSLTKTLTNKTKTLSNKVSALSTTSVKTQKTNIKNLYTALKKMLTNNFETLL